MLIKKDHSNKKRTTRPRRWGTSSFEDRKARFVLLVSESGAVARWQVCCCCGLAMKGRSKNVFGGGKTKRVARGWQEKAEER